MKDSFIIKFLYKTVIGRSILKILINPNISKIAACFLASTASRFLIQVFINKNKIDMSDFYIPEGGYRSFNDFFIRKKKGECMAKNCVGLISPCDGLMTITYIDENNIFNIKNTSYKLSELLNSNELAKAYQGGTAFIFRLTPAHYHRYIWSTSGFVRYSHFIYGKLHSVQPICHDITKVFVQNTREYTIINSHSLGDVVQMEIGALLVGKISNHSVNHMQLVSAGQEKGYFEYGGSTIVILTKNRAIISSDILIRERIGGEIPIMIGENII